MLLCVVRAVTLCVRVSKDEQRVLCCNCATDATLMHIQCHKCKDLLLCLQVCLLFESVRVDWPSVCMYVAFLFVYVSVYIVCQHTVALS